MHEDQISAAQTYVNITRLVWADNCVSVLLPILEPVAVQVMCWKVLRVHVRPRTHICPATRYPSVFTCAFPKELSPVFCVFGDKTAFICACGVKGGARLWFSSLTGSHREAGERRAEAASVIGEAAWSRSLLSRVCL